MTTPNTDGLPDTVYVSKLIATNKLGIQMCSVKETKACTVPYTLKDRPQVSGHGDLAEVKNALLDAQGGLNYIRRRYGDLAGVGFDRCEKGTAAALRLIDARTKEKSAPIESLCRGLCTCGHNPCIWTKQD